MNAICTKRPFAVVPTFSDGSARSDDHRSLMTVIEGVLGGPSDSY